MEEGQIVSAYTAIYTIQHKHLDGGIDLLEIDEFGAVELTEAMEHQVQLLSEQEIFYKISRLGWIVTSYVVRSPSYSVTLSRLTKKDEWKILEIKTPAMDDMIQYGYELILAGRFLKGLNLAL